MNALYRLTSNRLIEMLFCCTLGILLFTVAQFNHEFVQFEARFGLFAEEMWRNGISFFPTTFNQYYPDYPATQTILTYLFSLFIGKLTLITAILPTVLTSAITLGFTYLIGSRRSRLWGWYSVLFLLFTFSFISSARSISLDQFTTTATIISFYLVYSAQVDAHSKRLRLLPLVWLYGFVMRGPIGLIIPASVTAGYYLLERQWSLFIKISIAGLILLAICVTILLDIAWQVGGINFMHAVISMEALGRIKGLPVNSQGNYLFIALSYYALSFPIAVIVLVSHFKQLFSWSALKYPLPFKQPALQASANISAEYNHDQFQSAEKLTSNLNRPSTPANDQCVIAEDMHLIRHLCLWMIIVLVGLSIPSVSKIRYILPIAPAAALIAAYFFLDTRLNPFLLLLRKLLLRVCSLLPLFFLCVLIAAYYYSREKHLTLQLHYIAVSMILLFLALFSIAVRKKDIPGETKQFLIFLCATVTFLTVYIGIAQPIDIQFNSVKPFVDTVESLRTPQQALVFYKIGPDQADIKYMAALDKPIQPQFLATPQLLLSYTTPAVFIASEKDFYALSAAQQQLFTVIDKQKLGHERCVVFERH